VREVPQAGNRERSMNRTDHLAEKLARAGLSFRRHLHQSVEKSNGGWWIPTIAVCVAWALIDRGKKHHS
jgi:hypothetical protein